MQIMYSPYALLPLISLLMTLFLINRAWKYRQAAVFKTFIVLISALAWWSLAAFVEITVASLDVKYFWVKMSYLGIVIVPLAWLIFAIQYSEKGKWITRGRVIILAVLPVLTLGIVWTNALHHLMWTKVWLDTSISPPVDAVSHGPWFWVHSTYAYLLILAGTFFLLNFYRRSQGIHRNQIKVMLIGSFVPWVGNILYIAGIGPFAKFDPTPLAFAITGSVFFWGLPRLQLLDIMPVAYEAIFKSMDDGVIVMDNSLRITELNPITEQIFNLKRSETIGQPLKTLLPEQADRLETQSDISNIQETLVVGEGLARRHYGLNLSPIFIKQVQKGYLLIIHDDTERLKAEQSSRETLRLETELTERRKAEAEISHLASFPELNPNPIIELDIIGNVKYANPAARTRFSDLIEKGVKHPFLLGLDTIIQEGNTHLITRDVHIDDTWYEQVLSYVPSTQSYLLYSMEITERKQAVEELKMSEESLKRAQTLGRIGSWAFDVANQTITWSEETYVLYERDPKIGPPSP